MPFGHFLAFWTKGLVYKHELLDQKPKISRTTLLVSWLYITPTTHMVPEDTNRKDTKLEGSYVFLPGSVVDWLNRTKLAKPMSAHCSCFPSFEPTRHRVKAEHHTPDPQGEPITRDLQISRSDAYESYINVFSNPTSDLLSVSGRC